MIQIIGFSSHRVELEALKKRMLEEGLDIGLWREEGVPNQLEGPKVAKRVGGERVVEDKEGIQVALNLLNPRLAA